ncbi:putative homeobox and C2H2 transcription factor [Xylaria telfairii]|nr:putative homeobox and C2H2 transcription factor [Xylaria telfairii]
MTMQDDRGFTDPEQTIDPALLNAKWDFLPDLLPTFDPALQPSGDWSGQGLRDDFYIFDLENLASENAVEQPLAPCSHCQRQRLKCYVLPTTSHNPNPVRSCSSCVALFQDCSLAGQGKRPACDFETSQPVIGRLHGIPDVEVDPHFRDSLHGPETSLAVPNPAPSKRSHSRSVRKTQPLRDWFSTHPDKPYPSESEKTDLVKQSGLTRTQVVDFFTNARRRNRDKAMSRKIYRQGSPMPTPLLSNMSPLERWRYSPPKDEPASATAIQDALYQSLGMAQGPDIPLGTKLQSSHHSALINQFTADLSSSAQTSNSTASVYSFGSSDTRSICSARSAESHSGTGTRRSVAKGFSCSVCMRKFKKNSDLRRHEASVHHIGSSRWVCANLLPTSQSNCVWRLGQAQPECALCGHPSPDEDHFKSHEFESCGKRSIEDRTFSRKDHLWQHLRKFHGCRKWEGWSIDLGLLQQPLGSKEGKGKISFCPIAQNEGDNQVLTSLPGFPNLDGLSPPSLSIFTVE